MLRMQSVPPDAGNPIMDWAFDFDEFSKTEATYKYRRKDPVFLSDDP